MHSTNEAFVSKGHSNSKLDSNRRILSHPMEEDREDWVCLYTQPHREKLARSSLLENGCDVFAPLCVKLALRHQKYVQLIQPLFPRYVFARGGNKTAGLNRLKGISAFAAKDMKRSMVAHEIIEEIKNRTDERGILLIQKNELKSGQSLKIISGPLAGLNAIFDEIDDNKRSFILLELMGKINKIRISNKLIQPD